ncbi:hypothetical protein FKM82_021380 [Ascaphus truei]
MSLYIPVPATLDSQSLIHPLTMPGDFAMCLCLSPPTLPSLHLCCLRPCLTSRPRPPDPRKKGVVFADALGLALATVRHFSHPSCDEDPLAQALASLQTLRHLAQPTYVLDFFPPALDYACFRTRLERELVSLEQCTVQGSAVVGTVRVRNIGYEKSVTLRASFDGWRTHCDLPCSYLRDPQGGGQTDAFSFRLVVPAGTERAQFCVCFRCEGQDHWDNNEGQNYTLCKEAEQVGDEQGPYW